MVDVAVAGAALNFDRLYSYSVPGQLREFARPGARVLVPFGRGEPRAGVIVERAEAGRPAGGLKELIDVERGGPALDGELLRLALWLRETTFCTYCDAVRAILPKNSRLVPDSARRELVAGGSGHLETVFEYIPPDIPPRLSDRQRAVCELITGNPLTAADITARLGVSRAVAENLAKRDIVRRYRRTKATGDYISDSLRDMPELTSAQSEAYERILGFMADSGKPATTLLHGVTSSGKTLIYVRLAEKTIAEGRGVLVLVPEIALATQMIERLRGQFGARVGVVHSALSDSERQIQWERIRAGECDIVVGARSAVFAPIRGLGLIIIDEEQEQAYISDQTPRYAARDVAVFRARQCGARLLLSSATPSVESYYMAQSGAYNLVTLPRRYGDMPLPKVELVDMRREVLAGNSHYVSRRLKEAIDARLARNEQSILLLNRRGYRPLSMCAKCGVIVKCPSCDSPLVVHKKLNKYLCHYCGGLCDISDDCPDCGGKIKHTGIGTQKIEEDLEALFPAARILRLDLDAVSKKNSVDRMLFDFSRGEYDIIIGTQMIAKGLDFPNVTLVGVLSIDQVLLMPSFRAGERAFAMLTQVVGRSGRGEKRGAAIIQTVDPGSELIKLAAAQDYAAFYKNEIVMRKTHLYPPYCELCMIGFASEKEQSAIAAAEAFAGIMKTVQMAEYSGMPIRILGPAPMRVAYISGVFRYRVVVKHRPGREFRDFLRRCLARHAESPLARQARVYVDFAGEPDN